MGKSGDAGTAEGGIAVDEFLAACVKITTFAGCLSLTVAAIAGVIYAVRCAYRAIIEIRLAHRAKYYAEEEWKLINSIDLEVHEIHKILKDAKPKEVEEDGS